MSESPWTDDCQVVAARRKCLDYKIRLPIQCIFFAEHDSYSQAVTGGLKVLDGT
jgi:hypothetical protein